MSCASYKSLSEIKPAANFLIVPAFLTMTNRGTK
jgi:hypothetical protein